MSPESPFPDPALARGEALRRDMQALQILSGLLMLPDIRVMLHPEAHAKALLYVLQQNNATMEAFIDWQNTVL